MKKIIVLLLAVAMVLAFAACCSKDALAGTWTGDLGLDGTVTWTFDGSGKVKFETSSRSRTALTPSRAIR